MISSVSYNTYKQDFNIYRAKIISTNDTSGLGRVQVYIPAIHGTYDSENINYPWAVCGMDVRNGTAVVVGFEGGDTRVPVVITRVVYDPTLHDQAWGTITSDSTTTSTSSALANFDSSGMNTLCALFRELIAPYESGGSYGNVNENDYGALSIGLIQWHGNSARTLIQNIIALGYSSYNGYSTSYDWSSFIPYGSYVTELENALDSTYGHTAQDNMIVEWGLMYIEYGANTVGITDPAGMLFFMENSNQGMYGAADLYADCSDKTLDGLYNHLVNCHYSSYYYAGPYGFKSRRDSIYQTITSWASQGRIPTSLYAVNA